MKLNCHTLKIKNIFYYLNTLNTSILISKNIHDSCFHLHTITNKNHQVKDDACSALSDDS